MQQLLIIDGTLPGLNELIRALNNHRHSYKDLKARWQQVIGALILKGRLRPMQGPVSVHFRWIEKDRRRDPDNIRSGGSKLILDSLVQCKILATDSQKTIWQLTDTYGVNAQNPHVEVILTQIEQGVEIQ